MCRCKRKDPIDLLRKLRPRLARPTWSVAPPAAAAVANARGRSQKTADSLVSDRRSHLALALAAEPVRPTRARLARTMERTSTSTSTEYVYVYSFFGYCCALAISLPCSRGDCKLSSH